MTEIHPQSSGSSWPVTDDAIRSAFESMLADGSWGRYHGPHCDQLRSELSVFHGSKHAILCSSGTSAIELALRSVPVRNGDEVILSAYDFKANLLNVLIVGAVPVLVDVLHGLPVIDFNQLESACSDRTKAIIVSHLHGCLTPMTEIRRIAETRGLAIIEDACQCPGATIIGRRVATLGDIGVLSFGGSKLLTSGRGGALLTSNAAMAQRIRLYTHRGNEAYPLSEMQAAVLLPQLRQLDERNKSRHARAIQLFGELQNLAAIRTVIFPADSGSSATSAAFYKMAFRLSESFSSADRDQVCEKAQRLGIPLNPGFQALHRIHSQRRFRAVGDLRHTSDLHDRLMVLHHTALLRSESEISAMADQLAEIVGKMSV